MSVPREVRVIQVSGVMKEPGLSALTPRGGFTDLEPHLLSRFLLPNLPLPPNPSANWELHCKDDHDSITFQYNI